MERFLSIKKPYENKEIVEFENLIIIIKIENRKFLEISAMYKCHKLPESNFFLN